MEDDQDEEVESVADCPRPVSLGRIRPGVDLSSLFPRIAEAVRNAAESSDYAQSRVANHRRRRRRQTMCMFVSVLVVLTVVLCIIAVCMK